MNTTDYAELGKRAFCSYGLPATVHSYKPILLTPHTIYTVWKLICGWDQLVYNGMSVHLSPLCVFLSLELHNFKRKNKWFGVWVTLSQCFAYPMMRHWHQHTSAQPRVAAACDGYQLCLFVHVHICKNTHTDTHTQTNSRIRNSQVWFWSWSHLSTAPRGRVRRTVLVIYTILVRDGWVLCMLVKVNKCFGWVFTFLVDLHSFT